MKVKYFALAAVLALVFTGCSANREETKIGRASCRERV